MLKIWCTAAEICAIMGVSEDTLSRRVMEKHGISFAEFAEQKRAGGKMSLRRKMYNAAISTGDNTMMIWLSKNILGWSDKQETIVDAPTEGIKVNFRDIRRRESGEEL
jgi:hypothetical protein